MKRIICIGNRYVPEDAAGARVYDLLLQCRLPPDIEVIFGGLAGLDLLRFVEGADRVVFVDHISGFGEPNDIIVLDATEIAALAENRYDHSSGVAYLFRIIPAVCEGAVPQMLMVGIESGTDGGAIRKAAVIALKIAGDKNPTFRSQAIVQERPNGCGGEWRNH